MALMSYWFSKNRIWAVRPIRESKLLLPIWKITFTRLRTPDLTCLKILRTILQWSYFLNKYKITIYLRRIMVRFRFSLIQMERMSLALSWKGKYAWSAEGLPLLRACKEESHLDFHYQSSIIVSSIRYFSFFEAPTYQLKPQMRYLFHSPNVEKRKS